MNLFSKLKKFVRSPFVFLLPLITTMVVLVFYPITSTLINSFQRYILSDKENIYFNGLTNYFEVFTKSDFIRTLTNTFFVTILTIIITMFLALMISELLAVKSKIKKFLVVVSIIPWAIPSIVNGMLFNFIFSSSNGLINNLLFNMGLIERNVSFLDSRFGVLLILSIVLSYRTVPFVVIMFIAARTTISKQVYEASLIDGANKIITFMKITLPALRNSIFLGLIYTMINAFSVFDEVIALSGFRDVTKTLLVDNYLESFSFLNLGRGSAYSYIVIMILLICFFVLKFIDKKTNRDF